MSTDASSKRVSKQPGETHLCVVSGLYNKDLISNALPHIPFSAATDGNQRYSDEVSELRSFPIQLSKAARQPVLAWRAVVR